jgi:putative SOS response-associated peptidase YedK
MAGLHDRMPVVLPEGVWDLWLDPELGDLGELEGLFEPTDEVALRIEPVANLVNNVRNDGPELVRPIDPAGLARAMPAAEPLGLFDEVSR